MNRIKVPIIENNKDKGISEYLDINIYIKGENK